MRFCRLLIPLTLVFALVLARPAIRGEEPAPSQSPTLSPSPSPAPPKAREPGAKEWQKLKQLATAFIWAEQGAATDKARTELEKAGYDKVRLTKKQFSELAGVIRGGNPASNQKNKELSLKVKTGQKAKDGTDETVTVKLSGPPKYKPGCGKSWGLVITMHGGPMPTPEEAAQTASQQFSYWNSIGGSVDCMVAAPAIDGDQWGLREWTILSNIIVEADRLFCLDYDKVLLTGHSWGGIMTWELGPEFADRFACLAPFVCAVNPGNSHLRNLRCLPVYSVQGSLDAEFIVTDGQKRIEMLKALGYEYVYKEKKGGHEVYPDEVAAVAEYFSEKPRRMYAKELVRTATHLNKSDLWYWMGSQVHYFTARILPGNIVETDITGEFEVFLSDEMVDMDKPISIRRGSTEVWKGSVERSMSFALTHVKESGDRGRIFAASVKITN